MSPDAVIRGARDDGLRLFLTPAGTIKVIGDSDAVGRWRDDIKENKAGIIARLQGDDDRRYCTQCLNLRGTVCSIAKPWKGAKVVARPGYEPVLGLPHRCKGYEPLADEPDQRTGEERYPWL